MPRMKSTRRRSLREQGWLTKERAVEVVEALLRQIEEVDDGKLLKVRVKLEFADDDEDIKRGSVSMGQESVDD